MRSLLSVLTAMILLSSGCLSDKMEKDDAQIDVLIAIEYKRAECRGGPRFPLPVLEDVDRNALAGCVLSILDVSCPFTEYPLLCIKLYGQNVPGTVEVDDGLVP